MYTMKRFDGISHHLDVRQFTRIIGSNNEDMIAYNFKKVFPRKNIIS